MGKKKSISLGEGKRIATNYEGLKKQLGLNNVHKQTANDLLSKQFPLEYRLERVREQEIYLERRRDAWFSAANGAINRKSITPGAWEAPFDCNESVILDNQRARTLSLAKSAMTREFTGRNPNDVTSFTGWIFDLEYRSSISSKQAGKDGERLVQNHKRKYPKALLPGAAWEPLFVDDLTGQQSGLKISLLTVNEAPLYGKPDYVFFNADEKAAIIVEVKTSHQIQCSAPADGWPNLRAQLWAYAHLDLVVERAEKIILIGEIWAPLSANQVARIKTYRWELPDAQFSKENEALFSCYQQYASNRKSPN